MIHQAGGEDLVLNSLVLIDTPNSLRYDTVSTRLVGAVGKWTRVRTFLIFGISSTCRLLSLAAGGRIKARKAGITISSP